MSSAGTSAAAGTGHVRHADDAYVTEDRVVDALLEGVWSAQRAYRGRQNVLKTQQAGRYERAPEMLEHPWIHYRVTDAGCGEGSILRGFKRHGIEDVTGVELRDDLATKCLEHGPCLQTSFSDYCVEALEGRVRRPQLVVMNPPYNLAMQFVVGAKSIVRSVRVGETKRYATVAALLRLAWLASKGREAFHRANPSAVWVLPDRPSFTGDNKVDSTDYAWFIWSTDPAIAPGTWKMLSMAPRPARPRLQRVQAEHDEEFPLRADLSALTPQNPWTDPL